MSALLEVTGLRKNFGGLIAVENLSFTVPQNGVLGLIGVNGSGKSTVMNCINGLTRATAGIIRFRGRDITARTPHEIAAAGIGRTFQVPRLFRRMTLVENLLVPMLGAARPMSQLVADAERLLADVDLFRLRHNNAEELSGGQQKLIELLRVMMFDPELILLDEPFAGVHPTLCRLFIDQINRLSDAGKSFILVSHDLTSVYRMSRHILVLNQGAVIAEGSAADIHAHPDVVEAFLGR